MFPSTRLKQLVCPNPRPCSRGFLCYFNHNYESASVNSAPSAVTLSHRKRPTSGSSTFLTLTKPKPTTTATVQAQAVQTAETVKSAVQEKVVKKQRLDHHVEHGNLMAIGIGVPQIPPSLNSSIPRDQRQKALAKIHAEFTRIYADLSAESLESRERALILVAKHSLDQETKVHSTATLKTYSTRVVGLLMRLRKRVKAKDFDDVGIDGEWRPREEDTLGGALIEPVPLEKLRALVLTKSQLVQHGYPVEENVQSSLSSTVHDATASAILDSNSTSATTSTSTTPIIKTCDRCDEKFHLHWPLSPQERTACSHHWGRRRNLGTLGMGTERVFLCCQGDLSSPGCTLSPHVYKQDQLDYSAFTRLPPRSPSNPRFLPVLAMDCEMGYTIGGFEMLRFTAIDWSACVILDEIIMPLHPVLDYNTRFSGISAIPESSKPFDIVLQALQELGACRETILIGHGLENDLAVMGIFHDLVIDTVGLYPHHRGLPFKQSLKGLAAQYLKRFIQEGQHSSVEDSVACLDLVKKRLKDL